MAAWPVPESWSPATNSGVGVAATEGGSTRAGAGGGDGHVGVALGGGGAGVDGVGGAKSGSWASGALHGARAAAGGDSGGANGNRSVDRSAAGSSVLVPSGVELSGVVVTGPPRHRRLPAANPTPVAAQDAAETLSDTTREEPPGCMVTPYRQSAASIVRFWWLTMSS
jgi:hypothetical protein